METERDAVLWLEENGLPALIEPERWTSLFALARATTREAFLGTACSFLRRVSGVGLLLTRTKLSLGEDAVPAPAVSSFAGADLVARARRHILAGHSVRMVILLAEHPPWRLGLAKPGSEQGP